MTSTRFRPGTIPAAALLLSAALAGCGTPPLITQPLSLRPRAESPVVELRPTGGIYRSNSGNVALFSDQRRPQAIGDTLKVDIAESLQASSKVASKTSRDNAVASKGPGGANASLGSLLKNLANQNATASGSESFDGQGDSSQSASFNGRLGAYVVNVLANGNLVVAGERTLAFNGGTSTLRFSGVVNPDDIKAGNIVASVDIVDARLQLVSDGRVSDTANPSWIQRVLLGGLALW